MCFVLENNRKMLALADETGVEYRNSVPDVASCWLAGRAVRVRSYPVNQQANVTSTNCERISRAAPTLICLWLANGGIAHAVATLTVQPLPQPVITGFQVSGTNLIISGTNGTSAGSLF
jgi:hypothetical protein